MPSDPGHRSRGAVLPPPRIAIAVREAVLALGARETAIRLGLSTTTTARIAGRLPCHRASIELAASRLGVDLGGHGPLAGRVHYNNQQEDDVTT